MTAKIIDGKQVATATNQARDSAKGDHHAAHSSCEQRST